MPKFLIHILMKLQPVILPQRYTFNLFSLYQILQADTAEKVLYLFAQAFP